MIWTCQVPEGWVYDRTRPEQTCVACGHVIALRPGTLRSPSGREWPLVGNRSQAQERRMVAAIIEAHT